MKILALETSTPCGGAAVVIDGRIVAEEVSRRQRSHSELLHVFTTNVLHSTGLKLTDFDAFAVGQGPGSFTGIRVAADAGKAFAAAVDRPLVTVDTLTQIASRFQEKSRPGLVLLNAYKNMVYYGVFDLGGEEPAFTQGPGVVTLDALTSVLPAGDLTVAGDGWTLCRNALSPADLGRLLREPVPIDEPSPGTLGLLAHRRAIKGLVLRWNDFSPLYLRASEAEENHRGALFRAAGKDPHGERR